MPTDFTGLSIETIRLTSCKAEYIKAKEKLSFSFGVSDIQRDNNYMPNRMKISISFNVFDDKADPGLIFDCCYAVVYLKKKDSPFNWEEFDDALALAHIIPYVRELISNLTNRMPVPPLILPPYNTFSLVEEFKKKKRKRKTEVAPRRTD